MSLLLHISERRADSDKISAEDDSDYWCSITMEANM